jgi:hypothetical protein
LHISIIYYLIMFVGYINIPYGNLIIGLLTRCSKKLCNLKMLLSFATIDKMLSVSMVKLNLLLVGTFFKESWILFHLLWVFLFWINIMGISYFIMYCNMLYLCASNLGKNLQTHQSQSIWLMMIIGLFLSSFCWLIIS